MAYEYILEWDQNEVWGLVSSHPHDQATCVIHLLTHQVEWGWDLVCQPPVIGTKRQGEVGTVARGEMRKAQLTSAGS